VPLAGLLTACALSSAGAGLPEPRDLYAELPVWTPPLRPPDPSGTACPPPSSPTETLSLRQALALALEHSPELAAQGWEVRARDAAALQAGLPENPSLDGELEEYTGSAAGRLLGSGTRTIGFSQPLLAPGTLPLRRRVGVLERDLAGWDYEAARLDLVTEVSHRFVTVLVGQARLEVLGGLRELTRESLAAVRQQVDAGAVSPVEETRAGVDASLVAVEWQRALRDLQAERGLLAATWGGSGAVFEAVEGELEAILPPPSHQELAASLPANPDLARWGTDELLHLRQVSLARIEALPELEVGGGLQRFGDSDEHAAAIAVSLEIPLFDRNQGSIREARFLRAQAQAHRQAAEVLAISELELRWRSLQAAHAEAQMLLEEVGPGALSAYQATLEAYRHGKTPLLDVLDSHRTLSEAQLMTIDALAAYHHTQIDLERLVGRSLAAIETTAQGAE